MNKRVLITTLSMLVACTACNPGSGDSNNPNDRSGSTSGGTGNGNSTTNPNGGGGATGPYTGAGWTFLGRVIPGDSNATAAQTLSWPDSGVVSSFTGTSSVTVNVHADQQAAFVIVVDGQTPIPVTQDAQQVTGLDAKATHTLQLLKRNESAYGDGTFTGITLGSGGSFVAPPAAAAHRIEVIGDSISCGYGDLGANALCSGSATNEDSTQAYGPIAAAALQAEVHVTAWSGQGLTRSNTGDTSLTVPIHQLLDLAQVQRLTDLAGKRHGQFTLGDVAAFGAAHRFKFAFDHQHLQMAAGEVLLRQVGAAGDAAFGDVIVGDDLEQLIELRDAQALAYIGFEQQRAVAGRQAVGAFEFDVFDREAAGVGRRSRCLWLGFFAGQVLKLLQAPALLFQQAVLPIADQVLIPWRRGGDGRIQAQAGEHESAQHIPSPWR